MAINARWQDRTAYCGYCKQQSLGTLGDDGTFRLGPGWKRNSSGVCVLTNYSAKRVRQGKTPKFHTGRRRESLLKPSHRTREKLLDSKDMIRDHVRDLVEQGVDPEDAQDRVQRAYAARFQHVEHLKTWGIDPTEAIDRASAGVGGRVQAHVAIELPAQVKCPNPRCGWINDVVADDATA